MIVHALVHQGEINCTEKPLPLKCFITARRIGFFFDKLFIKLGRVPSLFTKMPHSVIKNVRICAKISAPRDQRSSMSVFFSFEKFALVYLTTMSQKTQAMKLMIFAWAKVTSSISKPNLSQAVACAIFEKPAVITKLSFIQPSHNTETVASIIF